METIRNYLETMFAGLPNTPEVLRARDELWQMMEDKYSELIAEGKSENAAIGTVISEFGNLDEIAGELGLDRARGEKLSLTKELAPERRHMSMNEAKDYLREKGGSSLLTAFGVFLCILSVTGPILFSQIFPGTRVNRLMETIGICVMMVCVAAAVGCFIYASQRMKKWSFLKDEPCSIDYATSNFVQDERNRFRPTGTMMLVIGIMLCVISWVPMLGLWNLTVWPVSVMSLWLAMTSSSYDSSSKATAAFPSSLEASTVILTSTVPSSVVGVKRISPTLPPIAPASVPSSDLACSSPRITYSWPGVSPR